MARSTNPLPTVEIGFTVNVQTARYLDRLVETGLYGNTRHEAARIILFDHCKLLIAQGRLPEATPIGATDIVSAG